MPNPVGDRGPDQGLIVVVLSLILMQGGKLKEGALPCAWLCGAAVPGPHAN